MTDLKNKTVEVSISTVTALAGTVAVVWFVLQPIILSNLSEAMAGDIQNKIDAEQRPIESAFKALLRQNIAQTRRSIALLEYRKDHEPQGWKEEHARLLADRKLELQGLQEAYDEL